MAYILANTLKSEATDGRFSKDNKTWASGFLIPEYVMQGMDMGSEFVLNSHPAVLDGFIQYDGHARILW